MLPTALYIQRAGDACLLCNNRWNAKVNKCLALKCGHVFHAHCATDHFKLSQWCPAPLCGKKVSLLSIEENEFLIFEKLRHEDLQKAGGNCCCLVAFSIFAPLTLTTLYPIIGAASLGVSVSLMLITYSNWGDSLKKRTKECVLKPDVIEINYTPIINKINIKSPKNKKLNKRIRRLTRQI